MLFSNLHALASMSLSPSYYVRSSLTFLFPDEGEYMLLSYLNLFTYVILITYIRSFRRAFVPERCFYTDNDYKI